MEQDFFSPSEQTVFAEESLQAQTVEQQLAAAGTLKQLWLRRLAHNLELSDNGKLFQHTPEPIKSWRRARFVRRFSQNNTLLIEAHRQHHRSTED